MSRPLVALLTDFGTADTFVGAMKAVILGIAPDAMLVDIVHDVPAQDVGYGALALESCYRDFPSGTVFLCVVDPEVGTDRGLIAVEAGPWRFVAPDNGLLTPVLTGEPVVRSVRIESAAHRRRSVSATFHGRDILAPAAAHLAAGMPVEALGPPATPRLLAPDEPVRRGAALVGRVVAVDRFGNLVTNVRAHAIAPGAVVRLPGGVLAPLRRTYADVPRGEAVAYVGSTGRLEIGVRDGSAAGVFDVARGAEVMVEEPDSPAA
ncbi:MAG TPA: SAM-dependent chlorinase/fluorinase [Chthonomonadales bacterium]|nr:SAM-dependent chlorinase/fluorinase [Chthonomonadales bacterium]